MEHREEEEVTTQNGNMPMKPMAKTNGQKRKRPSKNSLPKEPQCVEKTQRRSMRIQNKRMREAARNIQERGRCALDEVDEFNEYGRESELRTNSFENELLKIQRARLEVQMKYHRDLLAIQKRKHELILEKAHKKSELAQFEIDKLLKLTKLEKLKQSNLKLEIMAHIFMHPNETIDSELLAAIGFEENL